MCVFCQIYQQQCKADMIYQDETVSCFFPQKMNISGHLIVIPNQHYENIFDIPESELKHLIVIVKKLSHRLKEKLGAQGVNILHASDKSAQQSIPHFHIHIIPRFENDGVNAWPIFEKANIDRKSVLEKLKD